jgi:hypothetical protein
MRSPSLFDYSCGFPIWPENSELYGILYFKNTENAFAQEYGRLSQPFDSKGWASSSITLNYLIVKLIRVLCKSKDPHSTLNIKTFKIH